MIESATQLIIIAVFVEAIVEWVDWIAKKGLTPKRIAALVAGQVLALGAGIDLLEMLEVPAWPYVGTVLAGMVAARGANYVHGLLDRGEAAVGGVN